jgi:hypothetical protein
MDRPKIIGTPAVIGYDGDGCKYPGMIRVCFEDGHTVRYSAYDSVAPQIWKSIEIIRRMETGYPPQRKRKYRR